mmetsp:Transcript_28680/g.50485  ORF Transcript_28680/g.50485 Transcript_28680/m.50485 type:complete len:272 (-) Transcript_28680:423-1238(-)
MALRELLVEQCLIGASRQHHDQSSAEREQDIDNENQGSSSSHRVLIFAQLKETLDLIQSVLLHKHMPGVMYLRIDGDVAPRERVHIAHRFNADPSISLLLLTTSVGGLGLNLQGADTVIFVEHDWNPTNDLQAMDRAHRIGQKKVVNVYRLLTEHTLEMDIMSLQKFKTYIAKSVISENKGDLQKTESGDVLDLFKMASDAATTTTTATTGSRKKESYEKIAGGSLGSTDNTGSSRVTLASNKQYLSGLDELWGESQYDAEFNLDVFMELD